MANARYDTFEEGLLNKLHDLNTDDIRAALIDSADYTFSAAHNDFTSGADVAAAAKVAESGALTSPTITNGDFDTADFTWSSVSGDQSEAIILWNQTNLAASPVADNLIVFYDTGITGMPVTPNGGDINVTVNASGWWTI